MASWHQERQRNTHAVAMRLAGPDQIAALTEGSPSRTWRAWSQELPWACDSAAARQWRATELARPVRPSAPIRAVLAHYIDNTSELVITADRDVASFAELLRLATRSISPSDGEPCVTDGSVPWSIPASRPEWGLPVRGAAGAASITLPCDDDIWEGEAEWLAALTVTLHWFDPETNTAALLFNVESEQTLALVVDAVDSRESLQAIVRSAADSIGIGSTDHAVLAGILVADLEHPSAPIVGWSPFAIAPYPLTFVLTRSSDGHNCLEAHFLREGFAPEAVERFANHMIRARRWIESYPNATVDLFESEAADLTRAGLTRQDVRNHDGDRLRIEQRFSYWADRTPNAIAVTDGKSHLTYSELELRADMIARGLNVRGAQRGTFIGICLPRSVDLIAAILAVLKTGAAYVPVDVAYPLERILTTFDDASVHLIVSDKDWPGISREPRAVTLSELVAEETRDTAPLDVQSDPSAPAYVIYTSGSTGRPKGVMVSHSNVISLFDGVRDGFQFTQNDTWSCFHSIAFDFSVWEIWGALLTGAKLVLVPYWISRTPSDFLSLLREENVTILSQTPSAFTQLVDADTGERCGVRLVVLGGEALKAPAVLTWLDRRAEDECAIVNMYGITETTVHVTWRRITRLRALESPECVGEPIPGWAVTIRDPAGRMRPLGTIGEIVVGGAGVAQGYLNRSDLTRERFLEDPYSGHRIYRSGDIGRMLPDGTIEHLGRLDNQIKLRGFRIELDEVRSAVLRLPGVRDAHVSVRTDVSGDDATAQIVAFVVSDKHHDGSAFRRALAAVLPEHMVPSTIMLVPDLPLTANGKVDERALAEMRSLPASQGDVRSVPEGTGILPVLIELWTELFDTRVTATSDFFDLGGNSLLAVRVVTLMRERNLPPVAMRELYLHPTPAALAAVLEHEVSQ